ncbi:MAG: PadR family transcriptional regulator [Candidatus Methanomethyliaceae archaeon]|nr:PadR family transcriptional regulator [Candidatus Methanomethyliaceae archaeon]
MKKKDALLRATANGLLRLMIMWILNKKEHSGYYIMKEIRRITGIKYHPGVIYPLLYSLEGDGLIAGKWRTSGRRNIKDYSLTPEGLSAFQTMKKFLSSSIKEMHGLID